MIQVRLKRNGSRWRQRLRSRATGFDSTWTLCPPRLGDNIRLGVVKEVTSNHNDPFPISTDAKSCSSQGVLSRKWEGPVVNGLRHWLPIKGVRGLRLHLNSRGSQNKKSTLVFISHAHECESQLLLPAKWQKLLAKPCRG
jgi:hypothetical protein